MKNWQIILLIIFLSGTNIYCQSPDSLHIALKQTTDNIDKLNIYLDLCYFYYEHNNHAKLNETASEALKLSQKHKNKEYSGYYTYVLGLSNIEDNRFLEAINQFQQALIFSSSIENHQQFIGEQYKFIGLCYYYIGDLESATINNIKALDQFIQINNAYSIAEIHQNLGLINSQLNLTDKALENYLQAQKEYGKVNALSELSAIYQNIGVIYSQQKNYSKSFEQYKKSLDIYIKLEDQIGIANSYQNIGIVLMRMQDYQSALDYFSKAEAIYTEYNDYRGLIHIYNNKGILYTENKEYEKGYELLLKSLDISKERNFSELIIDIYADLARVLDNMGKHEQAIDYLNLYIEIKDSLFNIEKVNSIQNMQLQHEAKVHHEEIDNLTKEQEIRLLQVKKQKTIIVSLASILLILSTFGLLLILNNKIKQRINKKLIAEIKERKRVESILENITDDLENTIESRTSELRNANLKLREEMEVQKELQIKIEYAKKKAEQADKLKTVFLANMSHEIRTPMNGIIGFSQLLKHAGIDNEKRSEYVDIIVNNSMNLIQLIEDIVDISKIESGEFHVNNTEFNLDELLFEILIEYNEKRFKQNKDHIKIIYYNQDSEVLTNLNTDKFRLKQVIIHLMNNALKFTDRGIIEFGFKISTDEIIIFVSDTGIGIPQNKYDVIFDLFRQAEEGSTRRFGGTGLGLTISKSIIEILNGKIWLESKIENGSSFYISLPYDVSINENKIIPNEFQTPEEYNWTDKTILIAEDQSSNFIFLKEIIRSTKANVIHALDGLESIEQFYANRKDIDLILMDMHMPELNGYEATKIIRAKDKTIPILAQTAFALDMNFKKCTEVGCDDYITKPINVAILLRTMNKLLQKKTSSINL